ncbi:MAG TPA: hypothetical protein VN231_00335, partial [Allosphingosinicella sp.]|nr:hypothetical protein [Allosphingosinicella sp.]
MTAHCPRPAECRRSSLAAKRRALLVGCAIGAASALAAHPGRASAQAFEAGILSSRGAVTRTPTGPTSETITIGSDTAIITWLPNDDFTDPFTFLPRGNVASFRNGPNNADFVVLNRIASGQAMRFDGTVVSRLQTGSGEVPGGTILFASPGGIIVGPTALFDVGNLVLTTLTVQTMNEEGGGPYLVPGDFQFSLAGSPAAIVTEAGARFTATAENSYIAMVAPQITHGGATGVNGSAAYIAGENLQFTVNQGLFDILVTTGTDSPDPLTHNGSTGGPASTGGTDNHRIYMVAVPKNEAITALLTGDVGFAAASDVTVENGTIILSAGFNVFGDAVDVASSNGVEANFLVQSASIASDLSGHAATDMFAGGGAGSLAFAQDARLFGAERARLYAAPDQSVAVAGNALVSSARPDALDPPAADRTGGEALAFAQAGGSLSVSGDLIVDASATGAGGDGGAGDGTGGTARAYAAGGDVEVSGDLAVLADGNGFDSFKYAGGDGFGGTASAEASAGGSVIVSGDLRVSADGIGGTATKYDRGGSGTGGSSSVVADGGAIEIDGGADLSALGTAGETFSPYAASDGNFGEGGAVTASAGSGGVLTIVGSATLDATGRGAGGALGGSGGEGRGGAVTITAERAQASAGTVLMRAQGLGGAGSTGDPMLPPENGGAG